MASSIVAQLEIGECCHTPRPTSCPLCEPPSLSGLPRGVLLSALAISCVSSISFNFNCFFLVFGMSCCRAWHAKLAKVGNINYEIKDLPKMVMLA